MIKHFLFLGLASGLTLATATAQAQNAVTLGTSPYAENFDNLASGLPAGFALYTGATATSLGTAAPTAQVILTPGSTTTWASTGGAYKNFASNTGLHSKATTAVQTAATNRALGVRQTGGFSDAGPAFVFQVANTAGKTDFVLNFKLQSLDSLSTRITTWQVDYGTGTTPSTFTRVASAGTTGPVFSNNAVTVNFAGALDNLAGPVWIRVVAPAGTSGSGNRASSAIDDFALSWNANANAPALTVAPTSLAFGQQNLNTPSAAQTYTLTGTNLTNDATVSTAAPFSVSKDGITYATSITYTVAELAAGPKTVAVRYTPTTLGTASGQQTGIITNSSAGVSARTVAVTGSGVDPAQTVYDFAACTGTTTLSDGWTQYSVAGAQTWACTSYGRNPNDPSSTAAYPNAVYMNGYSGGNLANEDWLISPALNLSTYNYPVFQFWSRTLYVGPALKLRVSTNYSGTGNPNTATWTDLNVPFPTSNSSAWTQSVPVNLAAYKGSNVYVAFVYTSTTAAASSWSVDDITLTKATSAPAPLVRTDPGLITFGYQAAGTTTTRALTIGASDLVNNLTLTSSNAAFTLSKDGTTFASSLTLTPAEVNLATNKTVTVRFSPTVADTYYAGTIALAGTGISSSSVAVSGNTYDVAKTLEVANWNIEWFGSTAQAPTDDNLQQTNATQVLTGLAADVYGLAEIVDTVRLRNMVAQLSANLGVQYGYKIGDFGTNADDPSSGNYAGDQKLAFIYRKDIVKPVLFQGLLRCTATQACPAYSAWASGRFPYLMTADVTLSGVTKRINFVVIHAKANESSTAAAPNASADAYARRKAGADQLKAYLDATYPGGNTLIVGDYNDVLNGTIATGVTPAVSSYSSFLQDANYVPLTLDLANAGLQSTADYATVIDNVIASKPLASYYIGGSTAIRTDLTNQIAGYGDNTSDHYPVYSRYAFSSPDLLVNALNQAVTSGTYNNVTVTSTGLGALQGPLVVNGTLTVQTGGRLDTNCQPISGNGTFTVAAGGTLGICDAAGIATTGNTGAVQVLGTRSFSTDASYVYNGTTTQVTGTGLPSQVRSFTTTNASDVTLTQPLTVAQLLTVASNGNVQLNDQVLTLRSTATATALVVNSGTGTVLGAKATVQRYLDGSLSAGPGYRQLAAPVRGSTVADLSTTSFAPTVNAAYNTSATPATVQPFPTVFGYNESRLTTTTSNYAAFDKGWYSPTSLNDPLTVGKGYTVNLAANQLVDFVGTLNNGDYSQALTRQDQTSNGGWQLLGNPYPAPLDWRQVTDADRAGLDGAVYVSQSTGQYANQYRSYVNGIGNPVLPVAQGFFVRVAQGTSTASLTLRNAQRVTDYATQVSVQRTAADARPRLNLTLGTATGSLDGLYVYAENGATAGFDAQQDAAKLPNTTGLNLAALTTDGQLLSIQALPALTGRIALRVQVPAAGTYTLAAAELLNLPASAQPVLEDALTGQRTPLTATGSTYSFTVAAGANADGRFWLNLNGASPLATTSALQTALTVYPNPTRDGQATLLVPAGTAAGQVQVLDALGRLVHQQELGTGGSTTLKLAGLPAGVYIVRVQAGSEQATRRLTLN